MQQKIEIPPGLARIAGDRDHINTKEFAEVTEHEEQTVRKNHSVNGHCFGIRPRKVGDFLLWPVRETAALLNGGAK